MLDEIRRRACPESERSAPARERGRRVDTSDAPPGQEQPGVPEYSGAISILGERGAGKTTLLRHFISSRRDKHHPEDIVIGPITPLDFHETQSLFSYVLAVLEQWVEKKKGKPSRAETAACPVRSRDPWLNDLCDVRNFAARTTPIALKTMVQSGKLGEDFSYHYNVIQDKHLEAKDKYPDLIARLLREFASPPDNDTCSSSSPLLIVLVDDCDLFPDLIRIVLDDILQLCRSRHVAILFAANEQALYQDVASQSLSVHSPATMQELERLAITDKEHRQDEVSLYIDKVFPLALRVYVRYDASHAKRLDFTPLVADPNLAEFLGGDNKSLPRPSLRQLLAAIRFKGRSLRCPPNLLSLFDFAAVFDAEGTEQQAPRLSPFCALLPDTPRALLMLYQSLARFWAHHCCSSEFVAKDETKELIKIFVDSMRYGKLPVQFEKIDRCFRWLYMDHPAMPDDCAIEEERALLEQDAVFSSRISKDIDFLMPDPPYRSSYPHIDVDVRRFNNDDAPLRHRLMGLVQTIAVAGDYTHPALLGQTPPLLAPPADPAQGMVCARIAVSGLQQGLESTRQQLGDVRLLFPFWLMRPLPNYFSLLFYQFTWNTHVDALKNILESLSRWMGFSNRGDVDYLVLLHLHLVAITLLPQHGDRVEQGLMPDMASGNVGQIKETLNRNQEKFKQFICQYRYTDAYFRHPPQSKQVVDAYATFYIACAMFAFPPMASQETTQWIRENLIDSVRIESGEPRDALYRRIASMMYHSDGEFLREVLPTRPEGFGILAGLEHLHDQCSDESSSVSGHFLYSANVGKNQWLKNREQYYSEDMRPYPLCVYNRDMSEPLPSGESEVGGVLSKLARHDCMLRARVEMGEFGSILKMKKLVEYLLVGTDENPPLVDSCDPAEQKRAFIRIADYALELERQYFALRSEWGRSRTNEEAESEKGPHDLVKIFLDSIYMSAQNSDSYLLKIQYADYLTDKGELGPADICLRSINKQQRDDLWDILSAKIVFYRMVERMGLSVVPRAKPSIRDDRGSSTEGIDGLPYQVALFFRISGLIGERSDLPDYVKIRCCYENWDNLCARWCNEQSPTEKADGKQLDFLMLYSLAIAMSHVAPERIVRDLCVLILNSDLDEKTEKRETMVYHALAGLLEDDNPATALAAYVTVYERLADSEVGWSHFANLLRKRGKGELAEQVDRKEGVAWGQDPDVQRWLDYGRERLQRLLAKPVDQDELLAEFRRLARLEDAPDSPTE
ncbi:MAG: hypothetical protein H7837_05610 [Magnetococcus sp. MYC-9]